MANIKTEIPLIKLNDGNSMPMLGYGIGTAWYKSAANANKTDEVLIDCIKKAIAMGYTNLDAAEMYNTEPELGEAIKQSKVDRSKIWVTGKVYDGVSDVSSAIRTSLKKLQLDHFDLYLVHSPVYNGSEIDFPKVWAEMEKAKAEGLAKSIGVSNHLPKHINSILETAKVPPAVNQIEFHSYLQRAQTVHFTKQQNIALMAYGPLTPITMAAPGPVDDYLASLGKKYAVNEAEILLRWCIDQDITPVTTTSKEQRMSDYLRCTTFKLTPKEIQTIAELGDQKHFRARFKDMFKGEDQASGKI